MVFEAVELAENHEEVVFFLVDPDAGEDVDEDLHGVFVDLRQECRVLAEDVDGLLGGLFGLDVLLAKHVGVRLGVEQDADSMQQLDESSLVDLVVSSLGLFGLAVRADHLSLQFEQTEQELLDLRLRCVELGEAVLRSRRGL